ncbi:hypothetical protein BKA69DRAFT_1045351 [Paraphysoderma sedebokerense]|nr:hypothetical protein BKA69DRAFT_1045351 [Paraphysoderma sedebokerense]
MTKMKVIGMSVEKMGKAIRHTKGYIPKPTHFGGGSSASALSDVANKLVFFFPPIPFIVLFRCSAAPNYPESSRTTATSDFIVNYSICFTDNGRPYKYSIHLGPEFSLGDSDSLSFSVPHIVFIIFIIVYIIAVKFSYISVTCAKPAAIH